MRKTLLEWLRCPICKGELKLQADEEKEDEIITGQVSCDPCSAKYPIVRSIPRFVSSDLYVGNFSYQWQLFRRTQVDDGKYKDSDFTFLQKTGLTPEQLNGKLVLDVGVGSGRYADIVERTGAVSIGIDLSFAVDAAYENFSDRKNIHLVQADVFSLPFAEETFDAIYSIGVLHHTHDCKAAFLTLPPLLKKAGKIAIWLYGEARSKTEDRANRFWRLFTTRMPDRLLLMLCFGASMVGYLRWIPLVKPIMKYLFPRLLYDVLPKIDGHTNLLERVLKTFDWYSPKYQSRHNYPEVFSWFEEADLSAIRILPARIAINGTRN